MTAKRFRNRAEAGSVLAGLLKDRAGDPGLAVLGLPRGGVVVAATVAEALHAPLDVVVVRKLGAPGREELALGAIAAGGVRVVNTEVLRALGVDEGVVDAVAHREQRELERREGLYRGGRRGLALNGRKVIIVDDGLATGATMRAAITAVKAQDPDTITVAVPVASREARDAIGSMVDEMVCPTVPEPFWGVGAWYDDFTQTSDSDVTRLLAAAHAGDEDVRRAS